MRVTSSASAASLAPRGHGHLLFAPCWNHWEPLWKGASDEQGDGAACAPRPRAIRSSRGVPARRRRAPPAPLVLLPGEQYRPAWLNTLADLARQGLGEVELHLHHAATTPRACAATSSSSRPTRSTGHLSRDPDRAPALRLHPQATGPLANARKDERTGRVDEAIPLLFDTGCYADFTFPAAPDESQPNIVNQMYWPVGDLAKTARLRAGRARVGEVKRNRVLVIEARSASRREGKDPNLIENSSISAREPGTDGNACGAGSRRTSTSRGGPTGCSSRCTPHGAPDAQGASLLAREGAASPRARPLQRRRGVGVRYLSAREMFNVAVAAMEGREGDPNQYRDRPLGAASRRRLTASTRDDDVAGRLRVVITTPSIGEGWMSSIASAQRAALRFEADGAEDRAVNEVGNQCRVDAANGGRAVDHDVLVAGAAEPGHPVW